jgi:hypothetical protein
MRNDLFYVSIQENIIYISIKVIHKELKYFFQNYKDYYYLPKEDMAVHKSVSAFVDKNYRQKAKPENCYTKKTFDSVPIFDNKELEFNELFKENLKDKISYVNIEKINDDNIYNYVHNILNFENLKIINKF